MFSHVSPSISPILIYAHCFCRYNLRNMGHLIDEKTAGLASSHGLQNGTTQLVRSMGLFSATAIVSGSMVGSGIFIVSAEMSRTLQSPALLIASWIVTAAMTM